jgi:hypothetical protein
VAQKPAPTGPAIKQSAGVALAQTGPEGTLMSFSVDYKFIAGDPTPNAEYAWVIQDARGEELERPVTLRRRDTLQAIVPQWRPERGPFTSQIVEVAEDGTRRTVAPAVDLR